MDPVCSRWLEETPEVHLVHLVHLGQGNRCVPSYVPQHSSTDVSLSVPPSSSSETGTPNETTRTGSGYTCRGLSMRTRDARWDRDDVSAHLVRRPQALDGAGKPQRNLQGVDVLIGRDDVTDAPVHLLQLGGAERTLRRSNRTFRTGRPARRAVDQVRTFTLKSKRRRSAEIREPLCWTDRPRTDRRAKFRMWVAVCFTMQDSRWAWGQDRNQNRTGSEKTQTITENRDTKPNRARAEPGRVDNRISFLWCFLACCELC